MNEGWISLHRKFLEWEWFSDNSMVKLFIFLLLKANHKSSTWKGIEIKRGQLLTGLNKLNFETKISIQTLRTCLKRLEKTQEINMQVTNKHRIITVCNYDSYQNVQQATNKRTNKQLTSNQQATNKQLTTNNNINKENKENNDNKKGKLFDFYFEYPFFKDEFAKIWFNEFIPLKKKKKASITDRALKSQLKKIAGISNSNFNIALEILEKSVNSGWTDFYELKTNGTPKRKKLITDIDPDISKSPTRMNFD